MFLITILHQEDIRSFYSQCHVDSLACTKLPTGNLRGVFLKNILQNATLRPTKVHLFPYKQVSGRNGDHE